MSDNKVNHKAENYSSSKKNNNDNKRCSKIKRHDENENNASYSNRFSRSPSLYFHKNRTRKKNCRSRSPKNSCNRYTRRCFNKKGDRCSRSRSRHSDKNMYNKTSSRQGNSKTSRNSENSFYRYKRWSAGISNSKYRKTYTFRRDNGNCHFNSLYNSSEKDSKGSKIIDTSLFAEILKNKEKKEKVFEQFKSIQKNKENPSFTESDFKCLNEDNPESLNIKETIVRKNETDSKTLIDTNKAFVEQNSELKLNTFNIISNPSNFESKNCNFAESIINTVKPLIDKNCNKCYELNVNNNLKSKQFEKTKRPKILNRKNIQFKCFDFNYTCIDIYDVIVKIGEGTYGKVYKAFNKISKQYVALKKVCIENEKEGFSMAAVREIKILRQLNHKNIVELQNIITDKNYPNDFLNDKGSIYLVFEYMDHDLKGLLESGMVNFTEKINASIMKQLLNGLNYCHKKNFLHRDIKTSNILINNQGKVKIADFGLSRIYSNNCERPYTNRVVTLAYRSIELLLGEERYGPSVDIWSCGCILAELFFRRPLFYAYTEIEQYEKITKLCGTPTIEIWPLVENLPLYKILKTNSRYFRRLRKKFNFLPDIVLDLLDEMLVLDPDERITAENALNSLWLKDINPDEIIFSKLLIDQDCHELWIKNNRAKIQKTIY